MTVSQNRVDSVQVSWTPPSGEPAVTGSVMAGATATTATITGLITGATYSITMVATSSTLPSMTAVVTTASMGISIS